MTLLRQGFLLPNKKPRECGALKKIGRDPSRTDDLLCSYRSKTRLFLK